MSTGSPVKIKRVHSDGFRARKAAISVRLEQTTLFVDYEVDDRARSAIRASLPPDPVVGALDLVAVAAALYIGSLALAETIEIARPCPDGLIAELMPLGEALYDIRRWRDGLPLTGPPSIRAPAGAKTLSSQVLERRSSTLLWSGGKDSTLSLLTLRANGYAVHPLHASINAGVEAAERDAVDELSKLLRVPRVDKLELEHQDFLALSGAYADAWDSFPLSNRVPFGRDALLAALAAAWALHQRAGYISVGHDAECRSAEVIYEGRRVPRNDIEHATVALTFESAVRQFVHPDLGLLPPVGNLPELRILHDMLVGFPDLMKRTSFCFWGGNCGRCAKCLRYFLADRVYGNEILSFRVNPLSAGACPELADLVSGRETLFQRQVLLLLGRLVQRGDVRPDDVELATFRDGYFPEVEPLLDAWEVELLAEHEDPQMPAGFHTVLPRPSPIMSSAAS